MEDRPKFKDGDEVLVIGYPRDGIPFFVLRQTATVLAYIGDGRYRLRMQDGGCIVERYDVSLAVKQCNHNEMIENKGAGGA